MFIVQHKNIFFAITGALVLASLVSMIVFGLKPGLDFTGGTLVEVRYLPTGQAGDGSRPESISLGNSLKDAGFKDFSLRESGPPAGGGYTIRMPVLTDEQRGTLSAVMSYQGG